MMRAAWGVIMHTTTAHDESLRQRQSQTEFTPGFLARGQVQCVTKAANGLNNALCVSELEFLS